MFSVQSTFLTVFSSVVVKAVLHDRGDWVSFAYFEIELAGLYRLIGVSDHLQRLGEPLLAQMGRGRSNFEPPIRLPTVFTASRGRRRVTSDILMDATVQ
jgi:hypothetical protein